MSTRARPVGRRLAALLIGIVVCLAFAVLVAPVPARAQPAVSVTPDHGVAGTDAVVHGEGFGGCVTPVVLSFDSDDAAIDDTQVFKSGGFTVPFAVPADATEGRHEVRAECQVKVPAPTAAVGEAPGAPLTEPLVRSVGFTVDAGPTAPAEPTVVSLAPDRGRAGAEVQATGTGFYCPGGPGTDVELSWEDGQVFARTPVDDTAGFSETIVVPSDASSGGHTLRATCSDDSSMTDSSSFTVPPVGPGSNGGGTSPDNGSGNGAGNGSGNGTGNGAGPGNGNGPGTTTDADGGSAGTPVGLVVGPTVGGAVLLAAAAAFLLHRARAPRAAHAHVSAALLPVGPAEVQLSEPAGDSRPTRTVRLEPRADPGTQSIEETGT
ncbi:hypothetical protein [Kitasatospora sp. NPDC050543]|uniref:hypothetical protein n=1 Tax=Kitasatospora sp. NPDC050543 TaxID=3364054 RepID=UPI0037A3395A